MNLRRLKGFGFIAGGVAFLVWSLSDYQATCCLFGSKYTPAGRDGNSILVVLVIAIALVGYGVVDLLIASRPTKASPNDGAKQDAN
jgi:hypothetical protein